ncbi:uncharacterized protein LOC115261586 [Aedes albopictus]|uniref:ATP-dependent DNA helicase n=1 Tax=Aedes albopictus TaxID=7160 RepID=A0ABM1YMZ8_AEDAL
MSQYMVSQYLRNFRKRTQEQQEAIPQKQPKTAAERARSYRARKLAAKASSTAGWDAGEGPSTRDLMQPDFDRANREFNKRFMENAFGAVCDVCDRLWFESDLKPLTQLAATVLINGGAFASVDGFSACQTCRGNLKDGKVPAMAKPNGFEFPDKPSGLPALDVVTERLISPRLPFMQIRRLRFASGSYTIIGQVINCPVDVAEMLYSLPRQLDDDQAFNVFIKKHVIHKSSYLSGFIKKATVKAWLSYLITTPLYRHYGITIDQNVLEGLGQNTTDDRMELEAIAWDNESELLLGQQETLLWNEDKCLEIAPAQNKIPLSIIYDEHAEELAFPAIYYGHPRKFKAGVRVTYFMMASSETRRRDRRGAKPQHILYMAMKLLRLRVSEGLQCTFKCMGTANITRANINDREFMEQCIERNLSFLKSIPNSVQYWQQRKKDLFAMMRQLGKPTMFLTLSANEMKWPHLLNLLHRLAEGYSGNDLMDPLQELTALQRATLVNDDPVTCCIYFNKLVDTIMHLLTSKRYSPFGKYHVVDFFKRIEFQHRGSPHAHILLWLNNDPREAIGENMPGTVQLISDLCSVSVGDLPETYGYQVHKHTFTCFKKNDNHCRFNIPYWPMDQTRILIPIAADDSRRDQLSRKARKMRDALETKAYDTMEAFLSDCNCTFDGYLDVIRATIRRPTVLFRRCMTELWTNPFNPWIASHLGSNMDLQFILDEYSCAAYVVEYVNKTNRGVSCLQRDLIKLQEEFPDQDYTALLKKISIKMLNSVEMSAQEAAWYLLRQPMSEASRATQFIPTMWPHERTKTRKQNKRMEEEGITDDSTDIWTQNIVQKYESRSGLDDLCLADFAASYTKEKNSSNSYRTRTIPRVLQWCGYDMSKLSDYKREMVLLFVPFRNELCDVLDQNKFLQLYDQHESSILAKRKEYDCDLNLEQIIEEYMRICHEDSPDAQETAATEKRGECTRTIAMEPNDDDIRLLPTNGLSAVIKQRTTVMSKQDYCAMVRKTNAEQRDLVLQVIDNLHCYDDSRKPLQLFFTGPAGCGKTFTLHILMETYNRFSQAHNAQNNAYVACASTEKAAVAIGGTTVHSAFHITMDRRHHGKLGFELLQLYRHSFANVKLIIVDEISMIGANIFNTVHTRLQSITGEYDLPFGGKDMILCGDFRQLPPVNARPAYKPASINIGGAVLWQTLRYFPLTQVMRQTDVEFSSILTKIGNGERLSEEETKLVESRFRTVEWCKENVPNAIRLYHRNSAVDMYNNDALNNREGCDCTAEDIISGYKDGAQLASARTKLHKMSVAETGCLPYLLRLVPRMSYMITTNVEVGDGIVNGAIGELMHIEYPDDDQQQSPLRLWFKFENDAVGAQLRVKSRPIVFSKPGVLQQDWTPIYKRSANVKLSSAIKCKRIQFPIVSACALTIHKSQGGTFTEIVVDYDKSQEQQLVYVAMSRVSSLQGLYLTNSTNSFVFHHGKGSNTPKMKELRDEMQRLQNHRLVTISDELITFVGNGEQSAVLVSLNVQSLNAHSADVSTDHVLTRADYLALSETWMDSNTTVQIEGYRCISKYKRANLRAGGVAIYEKLTLSPASTSHTIEKLSEQHDPVLLEAESYGDICAADILVDGRQMVLFCIYISPSTSMKYAKAFMARHLYRYQSKDVPVIIAGDFNIDVSKQENNGFLEFMGLLGLKLSSDPKQSTTLGGSCIDMDASGGIKHYFPAVRASLPVEGTAFLRLSSALFCHQQPPLPTAVSPSLCIHTTDVKDVEQRTICHKSSIPSPTPRLIRLIIRFFAPSRIHSKHQGCECLATRDSAARTLLVVSNTIFLQSGHLCRLRALLSSG